MLEPRELLATTNVEVHGPIVDVSGTAYFAGRTDNGPYQLWKSNGTSVGTSLVKNVTLATYLSNPAYLVNLNGTLFFRGNDGTNGAELWKSDGTPGGTVLVKDILPGSGGSYVDFLAQANGTLFFSAGDDSGGGLWKTDGTTAGTVKVSDVRPDYSGVIGAPTPPQAANVSGTLFFRGDDGLHGIELWKSDGTAAGTSLVKDIGPTGVNAGIAYLTNINGTAFFTANDGAHGYELWKSDGTAEGTTLVKDIRPGSAEGPFSNSGPRDLTAVGLSMFFRANDGVHGYELWKSDGTSDGTVMVADLTSGIDNSYPANLVNVNGTLFFQATSVSNEIGQVWKSDGSDAGTVKIKDAAAGASIALPPRYFTNVNGKLFFALSTDTGGSSLWTSDGTTSGTVAVKSFAESTIGSSAPAYVTAVGGKLFFAVPDASQKKLLWASDGSSAGTQSVAIGNAGISGSKWDDRNGDGVRDPGESGLAGVTINLDLGGEGGIDATTKTDQSGNYTFNNIPAGTYTVSEVVPAGWQQTSPAAPFGAPNFPLGNYQPVINPGHTLRQVPADYPTIQSAINSAADGDTVLVAPGYYAENLDFHGKSVWVSSVAGPDETIIDGKKAGPVVTFKTGEPRTARLHGFTIRNGAAQSQLDSGGGILINNASPTITDNRIAENQACYGAGIAVDGGSPLIQSNDISHNKIILCSAGFGAGIQVSGSGGAPEIVDNLISNNARAFYGGGIDAESNQQGTIIRGNAIINNAADYGGGIFNSGGNPGATIVQNLIAGNAGYQGGGGLEVRGVPAEISNNTIAENTDSQLHPVIKFFGGLPQKFVNNVVVARSSQSAVSCSSTDFLVAAGFQTNDYFGSTTAPLFSGCTNPTGVNGNISVDPKFVSSSNTDYHLQPGSPLIDAGVSGTSAPATDIDGQSRVFDGDANGTSTIDIGFDEFHGLSGAAVVTVTDSQIVTGIDFANQRINSKPIAANDAYSVLQNAPIAVGAPGVLRNDTDADSDVLTAALETPPAHGAVTLNPDGSFNYMPTAGYTGRDQFTYRASDGIANSNIATVTLTVVPANQAPIVTDLVADLTVGPKDTEFGRFVQVGGQAFFSAGSTSNFSTDYELWKTDGTAAGTVLVKDIRPGKSGSYPRYLTNVNGALFFVANDGVNGYRLWKSDGTAAGTQMVSNRAELPSSLANVGGTLFFEAFSSVGKELWKSDGTDAGTVLVKDICAGCNSYGRYLTNLNGTLLFTANDGVHGFELWRSDGTADGTTLLGDFNPGAGHSDVRDLTEVNGVMYLTAYEGNLTYGLWKTDGTANGTVLVREFSGDSSAARPTWLTNVNGTLFFDQIDVGDFNQDIWKTDGTTQGTVRVKDLRTDPNGYAMPKYLTAVNGTLFFVARVQDRNLQKIWKSDGTDAGTTVVETSEVISEGNNSPRFLTNVDGTLYFAATVYAEGTYLWRTDGTTAGTFIVKDLADGHFGGEPTGLANINGTLLFVGNDGLHGTELWAAGRLNAPPNGQDNTIERHDWAPYAFSTADFGFADSGNSPPDQLSAARIITLPDPAAGVLMLGPTPVTAGQRIDVADILNHRLRFHAKPNNIGAIATDFTFQVEDNGGVAAGGSNLAPVPNVMSMIVSGAANAPQASDDSLSLLEDGSLSIAVVNLLSNDKAAPNQPLSFVLDIPSSIGVLSTTSDGNLLFTPPKDYVGNVTFTYEANDGTSLSNSATVTLNVQSVNDEPQGTGKTITLLEDSTCALQIADFGFSDPIDTPSNNLLNVVVTSVPTIGTLSLGDTTLQAGAVVAASDIANGLLHYTPAANASGTALTSFKFQVQDDGGTAHGGVDTDSSPNTIIFNVTRVNDPPSGTDRDVNLSLNATFVFSTSTFGLTDPLDKPANFLAGVKLVDFPAVGSLTLNGQPISSPQTLTLSQLLAGLGLRYTPPPGAEGAALAKLTFQVQDNGGTVNGGIDLDPTPNTITFNVSSANHAPSFVAGISQHVTDMSGPQEVVDWATGISPGPADESDQNVHFELTTDKPALFAVQPAVAENGKLTYEPQVGAYGTAIVQIVAIDDGGTAGGGVDRSVAQSFTIEVSLYRPLHNRDLPSDVTQDGEVVAEDVVDVINHINATGSGPVDPTSSPGTLLYDVTGDDYIAADDVVMIINYINAHPTAQQEALASGPSAAISTGATDDALLQLLATDIASQLKRRSV
jgi:ELWxxDGT repeat protein